MSLSFRAAKAVIANKLFGYPIQAKDLSVSRNFTGKLIEIICRRCEGTATEPDSAKNCTCCGGKGIEKLSLKALKRWQKKLEDLKKNSAGK